MAVSKIVNDKDLADHLREKVHTIHTWRRRGIIPVIKIGYRTLRYDVQAVEAALLRREIKARGRAGK